MPRIQTSLASMGLICLILLTLAEGAAAQEILTAADQGDLARVRALLAEDPARISIRDEAGYTPLHKAAYSGHGEVAQALLAAGADPNAASGSGSTPLHGAAFGGHLEAARVLLENGAQIEAANRYGYTPLLGACAGGRAALARLLLEHGADIHARTSNGWPAILHAVNGQSEDAVRLVLEAGADVNAAGQDGETAISRALWHNNRPLTALLVEHGADVNAVTGQGVSLAYFAVAYRDTSLSSLLMGRITDAGATNALGMTMLHYAAARGFLSHVRRLVEMGADVDARCVGGRTPLYYAELWNQNEVASYLRSRDASVQAQGPADPPRGPYLGQAPPGWEPQAFAENDFLTPFTPHGVLAVSPDGRDLIWCHHALPIQAMWWMHRAGDAWSRPRIAPFTDPLLGYADGSPSFSADGRRVYYHSHRPTAGQEERAEQSDIWYVEREGEGWGTPVHLGAPINTPRGEYGPAICPSGNLYFIGEGYEDSHGAGDIYVSEWRDGRYEAPRNLGPAVNSPQYELAPAVAPDESYILFPSNRPTLWGANMWLWVSFRNADASWTAPVSLDRDINGRHTWHPFITADGRYVFYQQNDQYYWFSAARIDALRQAVLGEGRAVPAGLRVPTFTRSPQEFEPAHTFQVALGDLDGDGDLDAVCANMEFVDSRVWLNDGRGRFIVTEQRLTQQGHGVDLGDLDGDGDLDALISCAGYGQDGTMHHRPSRVYFNDGHAHFVAAEQDIGDSLSSGTGVHLLDVDGDGDLDAAISYHEEDNGLYLNDGRGRFTRAPTGFPDGSIWGDLDGDGDVDNLIRELGVGFRTELNNGQGRFTPHWEKSDTTVISGRTALMDLDRDGDLDALVTSGSHAGTRPSEIWLNDGAGGFTPIATSLPITRWPRVMVGDLNGDGAPDAFLTNMGLPAAVWLNDGTGRLIDVGVRIHTRAGGGDSGIGDLDGDGDLDLFIADFGGGAKEIWLNDG